MGDEETTPAAEGEGTTGGEEATGDESSGESATPEDAEGTSDAE